MFTNVLLADEINRAPPKTQAALLEAMQERQTTLEGETHKIPKPFLVVATQNPIEYEGTYPLPEAQIDRFLVRLSIGYPSPEGEMEILRRRRARKTDEVLMNKASSPEQVLEMHRSTPVPDPRSLRSDLPSGLAKIIQRCLEKDPERRFQSVAELRRTLETPSV